MDIKKLLSIPIISTLFIVYLFLSANNGIACEINHKAYYLSKLPEKYSLPFYIITPRNIDRVLSIIEYPIIFKPNKCTGGGLHVEKIDNRREAEIYLQKHLKCDSHIIAQKYINNCREFNILYERHPLLSTGKVIAITERVPVIKSLKFQPLNIGYTTRKCYVVDHSKYINEEFSTLIDNITKKVPNFYVGRYDIKAKDLESLLQHKFKIIELNGLFGVDQRCYINTLKALHPSNILLQSRWFLKRVLVGLQTNLLYTPFVIIYNLYHDRITLCDEYINRTKTLTKYYFL